MYRYQHRLLDNPTLSANAIYLCIILIQRIENTF